MNVKWSSGWRYMRKQVGNHCLFSDWESYASLRWMNQVFLDVQFHFF